MLINLTDAAVTHLQKMIQQRNAKAFRLSVKESGCNGYRYHPEIIAEINANDIKIEMPQGLLVTVDPTSVALIEGVTIDYVSKGLGQAQLQFINPNVSGECGCGESFNVKTEKADG
jgi:iron-sulfur cluster assembly accessory protein